LQKTFLYDTIARVNIITYKKRKSIKFKKTLISY